MKAVVRIRRIYRELPPLRLHCRVTQSQRRTLETQVSLVRHGEMEGWKQYYRAGACIPVLPRGRGRGERWWWWVGACVCLCSTYSAPARHQPFVRLLLHTQPGASFRAKLYRRKPRGASRRGAAGLRGCAGELLPEGACGAAHPGLLRAVRAASADWTPDRGSDAQARERALTRRPALVETGRCACCPSPDALPGLRSCVRVPLLGA